MQQVTPERRRTRLGIRHRLDRPADDVGSVVEALLALHSTDPATVVLSILARYPKVTEAEIDTELYATRSLVRIHGMRRTLWVVPTDLAPIIEAGVSAQVAERERGRLLRLIDEHVDGDVGEWYARVRSRVVEHLGDHEHAFAEDLREVVPELRLRIPYGNGTFAVGSRVLFQLAVDGELIRTLPKGSWRSNAYAWQLRSRWAPIPQTLPSVEEARAVLVHRWLRTFGPGTMEDVAWWTGWGKRATRQALRDCDAVAVSIEPGIEGFVTGDDHSLDGDGSPWAALLPALDPTTMGWKERGWYLGDHAELLFDRNGNAGPTIWANGRIVGGWAHRPDGTIRTRLLEPVDDEIRSLIERRARGLETWLGDHVVVPRFRTPLERELSA